MSPADRVLAFRLARLGLAGLWTMARRGAMAEVSVQALRRLRRADVEREAERVARLRGARDVAVSVT